MQFDSHPYISHFLDRFSPETRSEVIKSLLFIGIDYVSNFYTDTHEILSLLRRISKNIENKSQFIDSQPLKIDIESIKAQLSQLNKRFEKRSDSLPSYHEPSFKKKNQTRAISLEAQDIQDSRDHQEAFEPQQRKSKEITKKITECQPPLLKKPSPQHTKHHLDDSEVKKALQSEPKYLEKTRIKQNKQVKKPPTKTLYDSKENLNIQNYEPIQQMRQKPQKIPSKTMDLKKVTSKIKPQIDYHKELSRQSKQIRRTLVSNPSEHQFVHENQENDEHFGFQEQTSNHEVFERDWQGDSQEYSSKFKKKYPTIPNPNNRKDIDYYQYLNQNDYVGHNVYQKMRSVPNFERISIKSSKNESDYSKESRISQENINKKTKLGDIANSFLASPLMRQLSSENDDYKGGQGFRKSHCESNYSEGIKNKVKLNPGEMTKTAAFDNENSMYSSNFSVFDPNEELKSFFQKNFVQSQHNVSNSIRESSERKEKENDEVYDYSYMFKGRA